MLITPEMLKKNFDDALAKKIEKYAKAKKGLHKQSLPLPKYIEK